MENVLGDFGAHMGAYVNNIWLFEKLFAMCDCVGSCMMLLAWYL